MLAVFLEVLRLLENLLIDFVAIDRRVAVSGQHQNQPDLEFCLDIGALIPVGVLHLVIDHKLDRFSLESGR